MSNHLSGADVKFPEDDARLDLTDLYAFVSPNDSSKTVLILDVDPFLTAPAFHPEAVYRINVDNDGDAEADLAFTFTFSEPQDGNQVATVHLARGTEARQSEPAGELLATAAPVGFDSAAHLVAAGPVRLFLGARSDPFFADAEGALHGFQFTGDDFFAGKNVLSIAIEVPNDLLSVDPVIGVWAEVSVRRGGQLVQVDRDGHPSLEPFLTPNELKKEFLSHHPADDRDNFLEGWAGTLRESGGYTAEEATAAALAVLPDILSYDRSMPAQYPNGRTLLDDVFDAMLTLLTHGRITSDGAGPHTDYLPEFPFLGVPVP
jgi:hypothetical protein